VGCERLDPDVLDDEDPFEVDTQAAHLLSILALACKTSITPGQATRSFYPAKPPAHWLICAEVAESLWSR
jgi:hypothetical protein